MAFPFFYIDDYDPSKNEILLDEDTSRHIIQVLRMKQQELVNLTDGKGNLLTTSITDDHKKHCVVKVQEKSYKQQGPGKISVAISLLKNANRFEWFLEKATEIGVNEIIPLICHRTEKEKFRHDRLKSILVSAMLQSQQCWLPVLHEPIAYELLFRQEEVAKASQKFIAHCIENQKRNLADLVNETLPSQIILIGPEGDFTEQEIDMAIAHHFDAVALGETRLRAETAGIVAATILRMR
ncbi:RsmE family RNA methyltransferase [Terrimonas pollutisoli]|uniref:RsmE family RNA methyltransferase n=1 Tax=Terrimonas pollutisoli TaxID=3034147 RepID=UPI0023EDB3DA|nr:RsmE family RNA methyltransferase [Terrimonas sp. H1YJ31]